MNALLICPDARPAVPLLSQGAPLALTPVMGQSPLEYWLEHLALSGTTRIRVLASDRADQVQAVLEDGGRWGLKAEVMAEDRELTIAEAVDRFAGAGDNGLLKADQVVLIDHLPGQPERPLFVDYKAWFEALISWMPRAAAETRVGVHELSPGVWAGLHTCIMPGAQLCPPCWIGADVRIEPDVVVGPFAIIEDRVWVERGAEITSSVVGPETFVGGLCELNHSFAREDMLASLHDGTVVRVPDPFLLCGLGSDRKHHNQKGWLGRVTTGALRWAAFAGRKAPPKSLDQLNAAS